MSEICARACESKKGIDVKVIDVGDIVAITEYFVICHGTSDRQVKAIVDEVLRKARDYKVKAIGIEGERELEWVLIDFGSVIVHVFLEEAREFYRLERLYKDAEIISWNSASEKAV